MKTILLLLLFPILMNEAMLFDFNKKPTLMSGKLLMMA
jgi:hypothetical protein